MKSDEGYQLDENTYFTLSRNGIHDVYREDPCSKSANIVNAITVCY